VGDAVELGSGSGLELTGDNEGTLLDAAARDDAIVVAGVVSAAVSAPDDPHPGSSSAAAANASSATTFLFRDGTRRLRSLSTIHWTATRSHP
jgi:hypothetical protein